MKNEYDWVHRLPQDFYNQACNTTTQTSVKVKIAEYLDLMCRSSLASLISALSIPVGIASQEVGHPNRSRKGFLNELVLYNV